MDEPELRKLRLEHGQGFGKVFARDGPKQLPYSIRSLFCPGFLRPGVFGRSCLRLFALYPTGFGREADAAAQNRTTKDTCRDIVGLDTSSTWCMSFKLALNLCPPVLLLVRAAWRMAWPTYLHLRAGQYSQGYDLFARCRPTVRTQL